MSAGIWMLEKDRERMEAQSNRLEVTPLAPNKNANKKIRRRQKQREPERYKLRKIGDSRIIGCMNNKSYAECGGTLNKNNYKKGLLHNLCL